MTGKEVDSIVEAAAKGAQKRARELNLADDGWIHREIRSALRGVWIAYRRMYKSYYRTLN